LPLACCFVFLSVCGAQAFAAQLAVPFKYHVFIFSIVMAIAVTFSPTRGDLLRTCYMGLRTRPLSFATYVGFFVILPWAVSIWGIIAFTLGAPIGPLGPLVIMSMIAIPPISVAAFALVMLFQFRGAKGLQGTHRYQFSDGGIQLNGPGFDTRIQWAMLTRCHGSNQGMVFMSGNVPLISLPARYIAGAEKAELQQLIASKGIKLTGR